MTFEDYLYRKHYGTATVNLFHLFVKRLSEYVAQHGIATEQCGYGEMLGFMQHLTNIGYSKVNINRHLAGLTQYFDYLKKTKQVQYNPIKKLRIRNLTERLPHDILSKETLQKIYDSYRNESITGKRDKMMLGLLVYQGLLQSELLRLEPQVIDLEKGTVHIRKHSGANARLLKLEPFQILPMQEYIKECRPKIIAIRGETSPYLFVSKGLCKNIGNSLREMMDYVKRHNPELKNQLHIRTSLISHWVKEKNLREAQYLAGHNSVNSTERYKKADLRSLLENLKRYHPLR
jgi:integrase/recombinase XerD